MGFFAVAVPFVLDKAQDALTRKKSGGGGSRPGNVVNRTPGEPSGEQFIQNLSRANSAQLAELRAAWEAANPEFTFDEALNDPQFVVHAAWGGDDGKISSQNGWRLQRAVRAILEIGGMGDGPMHFPQERKTPLQQTIDKAKQEASKLPERIAGAAIGEVAQSAQKISEPVVQDTVKRKLSSNAIYVVVGVVAAFALSGAAQQLFKKKG